MEKKSGSKESVKKERGEGQMERGTVYQLQQKRYISVPQFLYAAL